MSGMGKGAGKGALIGLVIAGTFGILTILGGSGAKDGLAVRLFMAFMVAGFYGAIPGAIVGWVKSRSRGGAPSLPPAPLSIQHDAAPNPQTAPPAAQWIGVIGESLETRATVLSVSPYSDPFATRAVRHLHYLRTPGGQVLRWLANDPRGLSAGDEVHLRGTVKDHTWDSNAQPITEAWCCQTRPARSVPDSAAPTARQTQAAPSANPGAAEPPRSDRQPEPDAQPTAEPFPPPTTDERRPEIARQREAVRAGAERQAVEVKRKAQQSGAIPAAPLAPVRAQPKRPAPEQVDLSDPERVNTILRDLDAMPGLEDVAEQVAALAETVRGNERRRREGLRTADVGLHLVFSGPPGTAKTTVAQAWGRVLCATGLLSTDRVTVVKREDLVGQHVGSTAIKTRDVIDGALGGVLFIDEAYSLAGSTGGSGPDFGAEATEVLLARMEEERGRLAVIVAGYPEKMDKFLDSNVGLRSRFEETINFDPYDAPTLVQIAQTLAEQADYEWDDEAVGVLRSVFTRLVAAPPKGWANGRSVRQILGQSTKAQHRRLAAIDADRETMRRLTADDARAAVERLYPQAL